MAFSTLTRNNPPAFCRADNVSSQKRDLNYVGAFGAAVCWPLLMPRLTSSHIRPT